MQKSPRNKMVGNRDFARSGNFKAKNTKKFYFSKLHITVEARTLEEATTKANNIKNK